MVEIKILKGPKSGQTMTVESTMAESLVKSGSAEINKITKDVNNKNYIKKGR